MADTDPPGAWKAPRRGPAPVLGGGLLPAEPASQPYAASRRAPVPRPGELTCVPLGPGRNGLPDSAAGPGREAAVAAGLYGGGAGPSGFVTGLSRPELRPEVPEGERDSFDLPGPVAALRQAGFLRPAPKTEPAAEPEAGA